MNNLSKRQWQLSYHKETQRLRAKLGETRRQLSEAKSEIDVLKRIVESYRRETEMRLNIDIMKTICPPVILSSDAQKAADKAASSTHSLYKHVGFGFYRKKGNEK